MKYKKIIYNGRQKTNTQTPNVLTANKKPHQTPKKKFLTVKGML
jgi:hypothetical protein